MEHTYLMKLVGKRVFVSCGNYAYDGIVEGIERETGFIELEDPRVVYETGSWKDKEWAHAERLPASHILISLRAIELIFEVER